MGYKTSGVFQVGDDVLLNTWHVNSLPRDRPWYHFRQFKFPLSADRVITHCLTCYGYWGAWPYFRQNVTGAWTKLRRYANQTGMSAEKIEALSFFEQLRQNTGMKDWIVYGGSDIFYVSNDYAEQYIFATTIFHEFKVNLEFAVPTLLYGIAPHRLITSMAGKYLWYGDRDHIPDFYSHLDLFMHSYKLPLLEKTENVKWFCKNYISKLDAGLQSNFK